MTAHLFVYGTLRPGHVRWPLLKAFVADEGIDDSVRGRLFDTGLGYPAATFGGARTIVGRTYALRDDTIDAALAALDAEESSVPGGYHRIELVTDAGFTAWAYAYGGGLELTAVDTDDWRAR